jgi:ribose-phosphate pyrophosphokinase
MVIRAILATPGLPKFLHEHTQGSAYRRAGFDILGIGIMPYFGYARQDIQHRAGESVSANVIIRFLESIGFHKIYTIDLHDEATEGVFSIPFKNLTALPILATKIQDYLGSTEDVAIVSPDQGGIERARKFGDAFFEGKDFAMNVIEKKRNLEKIHESKALDLYGEVSGKIVILVDDLVTSGGTLVHAAQLCKDRGATKVLAAIVHHDFSEGTVKKLQDSPLEKFFTTDTILLKEEDKFDKLIEVSVAPLIADALKHLVS